MGTKISEMTASANPPNTADLLPIVQVGVNKRTTLGALFTQLLGFIAAGVGAVARTFQSKARDEVSLFDYMTAAQIADIQSGSPTLDVSAAILAAVNAAAAASNGAHVSRTGIFVPAGVYGISTSACFTPTNNTVLPGIHFYGVGMYTSIFRYLPGLSTATWFYDNGASARNSFNTFTDVGFEGMNPASFTVYTDIPTNAKGFKLTSSANEQGFKFSRCRFSYFDTVFDMEGTNTASEMKFSLCKFTHVRSNFYVINNIQSFNHEFLGCDIEVIYGNVFNIGANGGGAIKVYGGSLIMLSDTGVDTYFFKASASSGVGAYPFVFSGLRFELRGDHTNLYSMPTATQFDLSFEDTLFEDQGTITKASWGSLGSQANVTFRKCSFYETVATPIRFINVTTIATGENGTVTFDSCGLPIDWSDRCTTASFFWGYHAINCYGTNIGAPAAGAHWAHDFDMHWDQGTAGQCAVWDIGATIRSDGSVTNTALRIKVVQIKLPTEFWPTNTEQTIKLPKNAIIIGLHLRKPAGTADGTVTTFRISDNTKTVHHLTSNNGAFNLTHVADVNDYYYHVGAAVADRTLRLNSSAVTSGNLQGGLATVWYI